jgi:hypothetical protein
MTSHRQDDRLAELSVQGVAVRLPGARMLRPCADFRYVRR